jgi:precorrin-2/cobalt-factor-2 C20-methyltransferase
MAAFEAMVSKATLYGVGVGPGDPELMTVKAWRLISTTPVIAYLSANDGASVARSIAAPFFPQDIVELSIDVPMREEREPARQAYDQGCRAIARHLDEGRDVAMLCEGDPFFYGSFMYVFERLAGSYRIVTIPGVSSVSASAARLGRPLAARTEVMKVIPATISAAALDNELQGTQSIAIIKVGRHFAKVRDALVSRGLAGRSVAVERATQAQEKIMPVLEIEGDTVPYFTTILVYAGEEPWR